MATALIAGATGLVGTECLRQLLSLPLYTQVVAVARRPVAGGAEPPAHLRQVIVEFARLEESREQLRADHVFCALGTTIRKAGSRHAFHTVDYAYPLRLAQLTLSAGARHFVLVSALGADPSSRIFYNRVKGEVEAAIAALPFRAVTILRPSLLLGDRAEFRPAERIGKLLAVLTPPVWRPVHARDVASAMVQLAVEDSPGVRIVESREIREMTLLDRQETAT
jgi:uncharacterized protein YbjT (DUF2867 family)